MRHLTVRVPWHDSRWTARICAAPSRNSFCVGLDRIREERIDAAEDALAGRELADLTDRQMPPCTKESAPFMAERSWVRTFVHPYAGLRDAARTHGHLRPTPVQVPPHATFAVPYWWMLRGNQEQIERQLPEPLAPDTEAPFSTAWVFNPARQEQLLDHVFGQLRPGRSLAVFYTKTGHPLDERHARLVVGIGTVTELGKQLHYATNAAGAAQPMWDRLFSHSITAGGSEGVLLPYHDYLASTGDPVEDERRRGLVEEIAVAVDTAHMRAFSYGSELAGPDVALATLTATLEAVRLVRSHGIAPGPWAEREEWLNARIAEQWRERGAYPGLGAVLEGMGLRLGTSLVRELQEAGALRPDFDPWPVVAAVLEGRTPPPRPVYTADVTTAGRLWSVLPEPRRRMLDLLSRLDISGPTAARWLGDGRDASTRVPTSDVQVLANPYRLAEVDLGGGPAGDGEWRQAPITVGTVDRALLGKAPTPTAPPVTPPVDTTLDPRRVRAALVAVLRAAAADGDTLLAEGEAAERVADLDLATPLVLPPHALDATPDLDVEIVRSSVADREGVGVPTVQLVERHAVADKLTRVLLARAGKPVPSLREDWRARLMEAIGSDAVDSSDPRHAEALGEQAAALEAVTTRRCSVLVGSAGTGKTTVLGALLTSARLHAEGVLLLAPTGKARVRLGFKAQAEAQTVAQFLYRHGRYDGARQRPVTGDSKEAKAKGQYAGARTVVIDEASMLTEDDLAAVLATLNQGYVQRLILVGDPNQLPPIGPGRPFADLVALIDRASDAPDGTPHRAAEGAGFRLTVQMRAGGQSAALALAAWFTDDSKPVDADRILAALDGQPGVTDDRPPAALTLDAAEPDEGDESDPAQTDEELVAEARGQRLATLLPGNRRDFGDLELMFWHTPEELRAALLEAMGRHLGATDTAGLNAALHIVDNTVPFGDHSGAEEFQVLSPVRMHPHGVHDLNRFLQGTFRGRELSDGRRARQALGAEEIVKRDKVICVSNGWRPSFDYRNQRKSNQFLANGEVGLVASVRPYRDQMQWALAIANREHEHFYFTAGDVPSSGGGDLELAYALTVHKAQGSEFGTVFVVVPASSRLLSRELAYTALTRARRKLVLLVEGDDPGVLMNLSDPARSDTGRRNTNLFATTAVRRPGEDRPFASHLRHEAADGTLVRSKSELSILNRIIERLGTGVAVYEQRLPGDLTGGWLLPDFTFVTDAGDTIVWEHLGMMSVPRYRTGWEWKQAWYAANGYVEGDTLLTTREDNGLLTSEIDSVIDKVGAALGL